MRYNTPNSPIDNIRNFVFRGGIPVTMTLLIISVLTFLASFYSEAAGRFLETYVVFNGVSLKTPWTLFTYPLVAGGFFNLLISGFFFWLTGGSLERSWGSPRFAISFFALSAISALSMTLGAGLLAHHFGPSMLLLGFSMPLAGLIVAFCMLNPEQTVILYFFPIRAKYVALIITLLTYFEYGPILGFFACGGILAAFLYVTYGRSWNTSGYSSRPSRFGDDSKILRMDHPKFQTKSASYLDGSPRERSIFDVVGRWRAWQERKRLEQLLKNSGFSDREPDWRDDEGRRRP